MLNLIKVPEATDLNREFGCRAYSGMSFTPGRRADGDIAEYVRIINSVAAEMEDIAETPEQIMAAIAEVEAFRLKYLGWQNTLWASKSRTMSPMITGPARFPVARNNKAMDAEMKKITAFLDWFKQSQVRMARRVQDAGKPVVETEISAVLAINGVDIVTNYQIGRIQMMFGGKPNPETIAMLKGSGWNWSPRNKAWQRLITDATMRSAKNIAGALAAEAAS